MFSQVSVTDFLEEVSKGNALAGDDILIGVYNQLRRLAESYLQGERPGHTLQATALVHEAYLRLAKQQNMGWESREHFISVAAIMMRRILSNYARDRKRQKRGGGQYKLSLAEADRFIQDVNVDMVALDDALQKMFEHHPQESRIIELRFFGGLTIEETAEILEVSPSTVERGWKFARAWLQCEMSGW
jgi:RNA polymerase sigma-70 factor, ECF subfamily